MEKYTKLDIKKCVSVHVKTYIGEKETDYYDELTNKIEELWQFINKYDNIEGINIVIDKEGLEKVDL